MQSLRGFLTEDPDRVGGFFAFTGEPDRLGGSTLASGSVGERGSAAGRCGPFLREACFFPLARPLPVMFSTDFYDTNRLMTTFASVFIPDIRNDVMTASLERQLIAGESLLNRFAR